MTRTEVEAEYTVREGIVSSPGKFEGEASWTVAFWALALEGLAYEDDGDTYTFLLDDDDRREWPDLADAERVTLTCDDQGFVYGVAVPLPALTFDPNHEGAH